MVELLVVLVILALIMGLAGPRVLNYLTSSREKAAALQINGFKSSLDLFFLDAGRYPSTSEGLSALVTKPAGVDRWSGPYLQQQSVPADPWGNPYVYSAPGAKGPCKITSNGADGKTGGSGSEADISSE